MAPQRVHTRLRLRWDRIAGLLAIAGVVGGALYAGFVVNHGHHGRKKTDSISSPWRAKMPLRMPMSSGAKEKASATALPTRSFSADAGPASTSVTATADASH